MGNYPIFQVVFSVCDYLSLFLKGFRVVGQVFRLTSLRVRKGVSGGQPLPSYVNSLPYGVRFASSVFQVASLRHMLNCQLYRKGRVSLLGTLLAGTYGAKVFVNVRLSNSGSRQGQVRVHVYRAEGRVDDSQATNNVNATTNVLYLDVATNNGDDSLLVVTKVASYVKVLLGKVCRVYSRNSLMSRRVVSPFFLRGFRGVVYGLSLERVFLPSPCAESFLFFPSAWSANRGPPSLFRVLLRVSNDSRSS